MKPKLTIIKKLFSKDLIDKLKDNIKKEYEQVSIRKKTKSSSKFVHLVCKSILITTLFYKTTINRTFNKKDRQILYSILKNRNYDFTTILKGMSYEYLEGIFNSYKGKDASYISRNRIHLIFDPSNKLHSGEKIEKTRKLHSSTSSSGFDDVAFKGLTLVGNYKGKIFPINAMLDDPEYKIFTPTEALKDMLEDLLLYLVTKGYDTSKMTFSADREFLNWELEKILSHYKVKVVFKTKKNTKLIRMQDNKEFHTIELAQEVVKSGLGICNNASFNDYLVEKGKKVLSYYTSICKCGAGDVKVWIFYDEEAEKLINSTKFWKHVEIFICNDTNMKAKEVYKEYHEYRWSIEEPYHKSLKNDIEVEKSYQGQSFAGHNNQWILKAIAMFVLFYENMKRRSWRLSNGQLKSRYNELYMQFSSNGHLHEISNIFVNVRSP